MVLCLGEPPGRFLLLFIFILHFVVVVHSFLFFILLLFFIHFCSSFVVVVLHSLLFNVIPHPSVDYRRVFTPILYFQPSPLQSDSRHFHFQPFRDFLSQFYRERYGFECGFFYPQAFFTLRSLTDIFDSTCVYQGLPWSRQFFLEVCRASY